MLYNLYRPSDFSEVKGQEDVLLTLKKQAAGRKFSHAYLLAGHRGTGKTTIARILSKAVNCEHPTQNGPCNACDSCLAAKESVDIIELDAASNNGVDKIKELMAQTRYRPVQLKNKVFIIDEVHNLSAAAFDVLLKPLEEPPSYCTFILCTTELHKIPVTIKSRCDSYQFHPIDKAPMKQRLKEVLKDQNADCEEDALNLIIRSANGGLRDALGLLEQLQTDCDLHITTEAAKRRLGMLDTDHIINCLEACIEENTLKAVSALDDLLSAGKTPSLIIETSLQVLTDMITIKSTDSRDSVIHSRDYLDRLYELSGKISFERLYWLCGQYCNTRASLRESIDRALDVRLLLIRISSRELISCDPVELAEEVAQLKKELSKLKAQLAEGNFRHLADNTKQEILQSAAENSGTDGFIGIAESEVPFEREGFPETESPAFADDEDSFAAAPETVPPPPDNQAETAGCMPKEGGMQQDRTETGPAEDAFSSSSMDISITASDLFKMFR